MFCVNCGTQNLAEANFCYKCGYKLKEAIKITPQSPAVIAPENIHKKVSKVPKIKIPRKKIKISWKGWVLILFEIFVGLFLLLIASSRHNPETNKKQKNTHHQKISKELTVGDTSETRIYIVKINSVRTTDTINEQDDPLLIAKAKSDETFVIVNLSIKNKTNERKVWSSLIDKPKIVADDGSEYFDDSTLHSYIKQSIEDGAILPDSTKTGNMVFRTKSSLSNLKFVFSTFDKTISWNLYDKAITN